MLTLLTCTEDHGSGSWYICIKIHQLLPKTVTGDMLEELHNTCPKSVVKWHCKISPAINIGNED